MSALRFVRFSLRLSVLLLCAQCVCQVFAASEADVDRLSKELQKDVQALEQIRERSPPWMTLSGSAAYLEAAKSIRDEEY